jgi:hypothetical protein
LTGKKAQGASGRPVGKGDHLYLIDGSGYIFRAFHALPPLTRKSDGLPVGAVSGFCNMLFKLLQDTKSGERPTHLAVIFDTSRVSFRNEFFPEYKAHRPPPPEDLVPQFSLIRDATRAFGVPSVELEGFEADDLIATYAAQAAKAGAFVTIVSSDKDLMQLVIDGKVELQDPVKTKSIRSAEVMEKFGVPPSKVIAGWRQHRQRSGRSRHWHQDGSGAYQHLWRPRNAAEAGGRDQAAEAARDADRECRKGPHFEAAGDAQGRCAGPGSIVGSRRRRA